MTTKQEEESWIELNEPKQRSRLLYTNPVCFLSTTTGDNERNVMTLSWLTSTNNEGRFMFSLNRRRNTASVLTLGSNFCLSVPVKGMEELVRHVGRASGRWGSKFVEDHPKPAPESSSLTQDPPLSKRQKKKQQVQGGVEGLRAVPLGHQQSSPSSSQLFGVDGTVAHLACTVYKVYSSDVLDEHHNLILAQITHGFVHPSYWDTDKNLFRPESLEVPPYLTFFGSQTFGYVVPTV